MESLAITIFGATGDLAQKKLFPALFYLFQKGFLGNNFKIIGFSRRPWMDQEFKNFVKEIFNKNKEKYNPKDVDNFLLHLFYVSGNLEDKNSYLKLKNSLGEIDKKEKKCTNKIFYLAVTPLHYEKTLKNIAKTGLSIPCTDKKQNGFPRIFIEKPFGNNLKEAQKLDKLLGSLFEEKQIFRIDHYLAKETLQNILSFRFSNSIFEPIWNKKYIEKIVIRFLEKDTIGKRGSSYDPVGALRDVGQNHMLQMLTLVTMEKPKNMTGNSVREAREKVLQKIKYTHKTESLLRGQYKNYKKEEGVAVNSETETYFKVQVNLKNNRFSDIPIILESGKAFPEQKTEILIYFKQLPFGVCSLESGESCQNVLTFSIQPKENISLNIFTKKPGWENTVTAKKLVLGEQDEVDGPEAYEKVLYYGISGDNTLFASTNEVLAEWKIIMKILSHYKDTKLFYY